MIGPAFATISSGLGALSVAFSVGGPSIGGADYAADAYCSDISSFGGSECGGAYSYLTLVSKLFCD